MSMQQIMFASLASGGDFIIEGSGLFDGSTGVLKRTFGTPTINNVWTFETIAKVPDGTTPTTQKLLDATGSSTSQASVTLDSGGQLRCFDYTGSFTWDIQASALSRDPASYYVWTVVVDTRAAVAAADRVKLYQNGVRLTDYAAQTNPANDAVSRINSAVEHNTSMRNDTSTNIFHGYRARDVFIDGLALDPTSFGELTDDGFWSISDVSGLDFTGTNSFLLEGGVDMAAGTDSSQGAVVSDPRFLSHLDGSDAATSATDVSAFERTMTFVGNAQLDTAQKKFGTASLLLDGSGDRVTMPDSESLEIGGGDFTMDGWMRFASTSASSALFTKYLTTGDQRSFQFLWHTSSGLTLDMSANGTSSLTSVTNAWSPSTNTWYHVAVERTGGKIYMYVDGTMLGSGTANTTNIFNGTALFSLGATIIPSSQLNGYIDEPRIIIGKGMYGGSSFSVETSAYADPTTGLGNHFVRSGSIISTSDSPTSGGDDNEYGNYCTWNPLDKGANATLSNGNMTATYASGNTGEVSFGTMLLPTTGKWYWENTIDLIGNGHYGIADKQRAVLTSDPRATSGIWCILPQTTPNAYAYNNDGGTLDSSIGSPIGNGDIVQVAYDADAGKVWFGINNTWFNAGSGDGNPSAGTNEAFSNVSGDIVPMFGRKSGGATTAGTTSNFGTSAFTYTEPTDFLALATQNLPSPTIINPDDHFSSQIVAKSGTTTTFTLPDWITTYEYLIIIKNTSGSAEKWYWLDTLSGVNKYWETPTATTLTTDANVYSQSGTTGTLGSTLTSGKNYLIEIHKAGLTSARASNTAGSIDTTLTSFNPESGFSLSTYVGNLSNSTIGHGMTSAPEFTIVKTLGVAGNPVCWHTGLTSGAYYISINTNVAQSSAATIWNSLKPTDTVINLGSSGNSNSDSAMVAYAWHSSPIQSFGSYEGNGSADGPFVNIGFKAGTTFVKGIDAAGTSWFVEPTDLHLYNGNGTSNYVTYQSTGIAGSAEYEDINSNGLKIVYVGGQVNTSGNTHIYGAWGGQPMTDGSVNQGRAR